MTHKMTRITIFILWIMLVPFSEILADTGIELLSTLPVASQAYEIASLDKWAFVAAGTEGIKAVDIGLPDHPVLVGEQGNLGTVGFILARSQDEIYVLVRNITRGEIAYDQALVIFGWQPFPLPRFIERSFTPLPQGLRGETLDLQFPKLNVTSRRVEQGDGRSLQVDVSLPNQPRIEDTEILRHPALDSIRMNSLLIFYVGGDKGYVTARLPGFPNYDYSNPDSRVDTPGYANRIEWQWETGHCFLTDGAGGFRRINPIDANHPFEMGSFEAPEGGEAKDFYLAGNLAYVAYGSSGLQVIDINRSPDLNLDNRTDYQDVFLFQKQWQSQPGFNLPQVAELVLTDPPRSIRAVAPGFGANLTAFVTEDGLLGIARFSGPGEKSASLKADFNQDGYVNEIDLLFLLNQM